MSRTLPLLDSFCVYVGGGLLVGGFLPQSHCISDIKRGSHMKTVPEVTLRGMWSRCVQSAVQLIFPQASTHRDCDTVDTICCFLVLIARKSRFQRNETPHVN